MKYTEPTIYIEYLRERHQASASGLQETAVVEDNPAMVIRRIREGLPMAEFRALAGWLEVTDDELAGLLGISRATYHRRRKAEQLAAPESERLIRIGRLLSRATEVLETEEAAREWLKTPATAFGGESPLSFADTEIGAREVEFLLGRLEHGVFS